jgi:small subunit ribosomal protein S6e
MKLHIANPSTGGQKLIEIEDEEKLRAFYDKRISHEVEGDVLGDDFKGYVFQITGGNDKQGFPMKQGVLTTKRVRLLLKEGMKCYVAKKRGESKRKSVRGCIVSHELSVLSLIVVKKGEKDIPGLTDTPLQNRVGPKRATRIRTLFNLGRKEDVRPFVIKRTIVKEGKRPQVKRPNVQRLVTPARLQRKKRMKTLKRKRYEANHKAALAFNDLVAKRFQQAKEERVAKRQRSMSRKMSEKAN